MWIGGWVKELFIIALLKMTFLFHNVFFNENTWFISVSF